MFNPALAKRKIKDYALIGGGETAALVSRTGSIDFLCWPHFHSEACFASLVGNDSNGHWSLRPNDWKTVERRYRDHTAILETRFVTECGAVTVIDFMPAVQDRDESSSLVRIVVGERGHVPMQMKLNLRFDYGRLTPWISQCSDGTIKFTCGPHAVALYSGVEPSCDRSQCEATFTISAGEQKSFALQHAPSFCETRLPINVDQELAATERFWRHWVRNCTYQGPYLDAVLRSLITIKIMTSRRTGGIIAAPTMGLPEKLGGKRNWDYRFCWLRDATLTLLTLTHSGFHDEACAWRDWLLRAVAGMPKEVQPLYGVAGEHRLPEWNIDWLSGFHNSHPVRAGNAAYRQLQIDIYGEVLDALHQSREQGIPPEDWSWRLQRELVAQVEQIWREPDAGIWEARHGREHFTHSRVMAWVAVDRAIRAAEKYRLDWPLTRLRALREEIHREVCEKGYDVDSGGFVRSYETREPDGATLMIPIVGFLPATDSRMLKTVQLVERKLMNDGFVMRYDTAKSEDGLPEGEGVFLPCSFWYVDNLVMQGRKDEARRIFDRLLAVANDVGLLSEEYDPQTRELLGNFPQALSHLTLVNSALNIEDFGPAHARASSKDGRRRALADASPSRDAPRQSDSSTGTVAQIVR
jgi:GH15 family glucan-1,4-alpha-glucosidase